MSREEVGEKQCNCGTAGTVNLLCMVCDIGEPCLFQQHLKVNRMLKPDKWQAFFDSFGKVSGFQKALKLIVLGGVDPSIRPEVWEFLLGCYRIGSTAEYRQQLREARRKKYQELIKECQAMHSSVGTGTLAYIVGSKVMDVRTSSNNYNGVDDSIKSVENSTDLTNKKDKDAIWPTNCTEHSCEDEKEGSNVRESSCSQEYGSGWYLLARNSSYGFSPKAEEEAYHARNLFSREEDEKIQSMIMENPSVDQKVTFENAMHSFQISNNKDLITESSDSHSSSLSHNEQLEPSVDNCNGSNLGCCEDAELIKCPHLLSCGTEVDKIPDAQEKSMNVSASSNVRASEDRISEWLWTLHRIVVDVVRTDSNLEFYEDKRNLARMSDILAVYAWVDPGTGYCQGMSDLLSPFVVIFEDDADAFWCFEILLRKLRENFQMEGPTGVMKQLQTLWQILEFTDKEMFYHLSRIGAESLHFAFRMLMVLFRRELSFNDALCMWEMMWAADFDESEAFDLEDICLEALLIDFPKDPISDFSEHVEEAEHDFKDESMERNPNFVNSIINDTKSPSTRVLCGLARSFWPKTDLLPVNKVVSSAKNGNDELSVFCVAAILILNRQKLIRETKSIDDMIKIFNDKLLKIQVTRSIRTAIKLRKKYFYKIMRNKITATQHSDDVVT